MNAFVIQLLNCNIIFPVWDQLRKLQVNFTKYTINLDALSKLLVKKDAV